MHFFVLAPYVGISDSGLGGESGEEPAYVCNVRTACLSIAVLDLILNVMFSGRTHVI